MCTDHLLTVHVVAATWCQYQGWEPTPSGPMSGGRYPPQTYPPLDIPNPKKDLIPVVPTAWKDMGPGIPTPPPNRMTDICENITFPQLLLQAVIRDKTSQIIALHNSFECGMRD